MSDRICSVPNCRRPRNCRGYCKAHYKRLLEHGDARPDVPLRELPKAREREQIVDRILARCIKTPEGCIEWQGPTHNGYGSICWAGRDWQIHRAMWTATVGPIPDGLTIDHLCRNRACVNTDHLEVVTRWENTRRGGGLLVAQAKNRTRQFCPNGHRYTPDTLYRSGSGHKICKTCKRAMWRKSSAKTNAARQAKYREAREAGATIYQAQHAEWWKHPAIKP